MKKIIGILAARQGQGLTEYVLLISLVAMLVLVSLISLEAATEKSLYQSVKSLFS